MRRNRKKKGIFAVLFICLVIAALVIIGIKIYDYSKTEIQKYRYPLEYSDIVEKYSKEFNVPKTVVYAVINAESAFNPNATSAVGACGLMQLMPDTFEWLVSKLGENISLDMIYDPDTNIKVGTYYLSRLFANLGNWEHAYAAYNAGLTRVKGWLEDEQYAKDGILINIPIKETADYVAKVKEAREKYMQLYNMGETGNGNQ